MTLSERFVQTKAAEVSDEHRIPKGNPSDLGRDPWNVLDQVHESVHSLGATF